MEQLLFSRFRLVLPKETTDDPEFAWWAEPNDQIRLVVNGALGSADTTVVVQGTDPSSSSLGVNYGSALNLKPGDILLVEPTAETSSFTHELLLVYSGRFVCNSVRCAARLRRFFCGVDF
jgi:hypothetical protein